MHVCCNLYLLYLLPLTVLQKPPTISQLTRLSDAFLSKNNWTSILIHMGVSLELCQQYKYDESSYTMKFLEVAKDWLAGKEGTGELPRTRDTVLEALKIYPHLSENQLKQASKFLMED